MWMTNAPPLSVGEGDTNGVHAQILGQQYVRRNGTNTVAQGAILGYKLVKNNSGGTLSAGAAVIEQETAGLVNGNVTTTTTANDPDWCGIVPAEWGTNTVPNGAYFLLQILGPGRPQFAQTTFTQTAANNGALGTATTAGYTQLLIGTTTGTAAATLNDVDTHLLGMFARVTSTAAVTAAGQLGFAELAPFN